MKYIFKRNNSESKGPIPKKQVYLFVGLLICILALLILGISLVRDVFDDPAGSGGQKDKDHLVQRENDDDSVTLQLVYAYQNPMWNGAMEAMIESFEAAYPDIDIQYEINYEDQVYEDILSKKIARNELGDLVQLKTPAAYAKSGLLTPVRQDVADLVKENYILDDQVYGVGMVESTWGVLYNKQIFETYGLTIPNTYDAFLLNCRKLEEAGQIPIGVGGQDLWHMEFWMNHFFKTDVVAQDEEWLKHCANGEKAWTDEAPRNMMNHLYELFHSGYVNKDWMTTTDAQLTYRFSEGEVAMIYTGPWTAATVAGINPDFEAGWFFVPDEDGIVVASDHQDTYLAVTKACGEDERKYEAAMTFLRYYYSSDQYEQLCRQTYTFPLTDVSITYGKDSMQGTVQTAYEAADRYLQTYLGDEDTPENFEKQLLLILRSVLNDVYSVENGLQRIQNIWVKYGEGGAS